MHEVVGADRRAVGGGAEAVWRGAVAHAVNFAGGLHHAMPGAASGFCVYNDPALAMARLLELGAERVAYVDRRRAPRGRGAGGVLGRPRVLTVSLHEHPRTLFPRPGGPRSAAGEGAEGSR